MLHFALLYHTTEKDVLITPTQPRRLRLAMLGPPSFTRFARRLAPQSAPLASPRLRLVYAAGLGCAAGFAPASHSPSLWSSLGFRTQASRPPSHPSSRLSSPPFALLRSRLRSTSPPVASIAPHPHPAARLLLRSPVAPAHTSGWAARVASQSLFVSIGAGC